MNRFKTERKVTLVKCAINILVDIDIVGNKPYTIS